MLLTSLSFCCVAPSRRITLPGKPQSDKPRVRAEPDEPKALLLFQTLPFSHRFLTVNEDRISIMHNAITDGISQNRIRQFFPPTGNVKLRAQIYLQSLRNCISTFYYRAQSSRKRCSISPESMLNLPGGGAQFGAEYSKAPLPSILPDSMILAKKAPCGT